MPECNHDDQGLFHLHAPAEKMKLAFFCTIVVLILELAGGFISNSLSLLSDAGHVLTDLAAIGFSWFSVTQARRPPTAAMTFGYHRSGILTALFNSVTLILLTIAILWEALHRIQAPAVIDSRWMFLSAGTGLIVNLWLGLSMREASHDLNVRSAMLHILGDAAASAGVLIGGILIGWTGWTLIDPLLSICIALIIGFGAWKVLGTAVTILMEGTPKEISLRKVIEAILQTSGILEVHDLHVWSLASHHNALSCHIVMDGRYTVEQCQLLLRDLEHRLLHLGIRHTTIQIEDSRNPHLHHLFCIHHSRDPHLHVHH